MGFFSWKEDWYEPRSQTDLGLRSDSAICLLYVSVNSSIRKAKPLRMMRNKKFIIGIRPHTIVGEYVVGKLWSAHIISGVKISGDSVCQAETGVCKRPRHTLIGPMHKLSFVVTYSGLQLREGSWNYRVCEETLDFVNLGNELKNNQKDHCVEFISHTADAIFVGWNKSLLTALSWENAIAPPSGLSVTTPCEVYVLLKSQLPEQACKRSSRLRKGLHSKDTQLSPLTAPSTKKSGGRSSTFPWTWLHPFLTGGLLAPPFGLPEAPPCWVSAPQSVWDLRQTELCGSEARPTTPIWL